jgi:uncharacterized membrane protein
MMLKYLTAYGVSALAFGLLDLVWLRTMAPRLYRPELGDMMASQFRLAPAVAFYLLYLVGMQIFAVAPALASGRWLTALIYGALFGFFCYATYDLTNQATLRVWSLKVTLADLAWGTFATGTAAAIAAAVTLAIHGARAG